LDLAEPLHQVPRASTTSIYRISLRVGLGLRSADLKRYATLFIYSVRNRGCVNIRGALSIRWPFPPTFTKPSIYFALYLLGQLWGSSDHKVLCFAFQSSVYYSYFLWLFLYFFCIAMYALEFEVFIPSSLQLMELACKRNLFFHFFTSISQLPPTSSTFLFLFHFVIIHKRFFNTAFLHAVPEDIGLSVNTSIIDKRIFSRFELGFGDDPGIPTRLSPRQNSGEIVVIITSPSYWVRV